MQTRSVQFIKIASCCGKPALRILIVLFLILMPISGIQTVLASDITGATYQGTLTVTNNSTATTNVATVFTASTSSWITSGYVSSNLSNTSIQSDSGVDVAYMPAISGSNSWFVFVPTIGTGSRSYKLYTGGTDMAGKIRYFPGAGGMTVGDSATLELGNNFEVEISAYFDTSSPLNILTKKGASAAYTIEVSPAGTIKASTEGAALADVSAVVASGEHVIKFTDDTTNRKMYVDGALVSTSTHSQIVPNNTTDWTIFASAATPYVNYVKMTVSGVLRGYWYWQNAASFTDQSGNGHTATPTFRTASSDADVSASLTSFTPVSSAQISSYPLGSSTSVVSGNITVPSQMYHEGVDADFAKVPGGVIANTLLDTGGLPRALWWYPFLIIGIAIIGLLTYEATTMVIERSNPYLAIQQHGMRLQSGAKDGSLLAMCIIIELCLVAIGMMGAAGTGSIMPLWMAFIFLIPILLVISTQTNVKT